MKLKRLALITALTFVIAPLSACAADTEAGPAPAATHTADKPVETLKPTVEPDAPTPPKTPESDTPAKPSDKAEENQADNDTDSPKSKKDEPKKDSPKKPEPKQDTRPAPPKKDTSKPAPKPKQEPSKPAPKNDAPKKPAPKKPAPKPKKDSPKPSAAPTGPPKGGGTYTGTNITCWYDKSIKTTLVSYTAVFTNGYKKRVEGLPHNGSHLTNLVTAGDTYYPDAKTPLITVEMCKDHPYKDLMD